MSECVDCAKVLWTSCLWTASEQSDVWSCQWQLHRCRSMALSLFRLSRLEKKVNERKQKYTEKSTVTLTTFKRRQLLSSDQILHHNDIDDWWTLIEMYYGQNTKKLTILLFRSRCNISCSIFTYFMDNLIKLLYYLLQTFTNCWHFLQAFIYIYIYIYIYMLCLVINMKKMRNFWEKLIMFAYLHDVYVDCSLHIFLILL